MKGYVFEKINNENIKERLNKEIEQGAITQQKLSENIDVTRQMVSSYKTTQKMPSLETFARICAVLKLDANYVLGIRDFED